MLILVVAGLAHVASFRVEGPHAETRTVLISPGSSLAAIAEQLETAGVIRSALLFEAGLRVTSAGRRLQAGEYVYPPRASMWQVADMMVQGQTLLHRVTLVEGATVAEMLQTLDDAEALAGEITDPPAEGTLFPDTYFFERGTRRSAIVRRAQARMTELLEQEWANRAADLPYQTPGEALILASIVEAETSQAAERARIAGVFVNRLRRAMRLQSDPTVLYGMEPDTRSLSRADLERHHPWNTYTIRGLPPTPIGNPGLASIQAAMAPAATPEYYFVADGAGGHAFAKTLREHNRNVARFRAMQRQRAAEQSATGAEQ